MELRPELLVRRAGTVTSLLVSVPPIFSRYYEQTEFATDNAAQAGGEMVVGLLACAAFATLFWMATRPENLLGGTNLWWILSAQVVLALLAGTTDLLILMAAEAGRLLPGRNGFKFFALLLGLLGAQWLSAIANGTFVTMPEVAS